MAIPSVNETIRDGALGIVPPGSGNVHLKIGVAPLGLLNSLQSVTDMTSLQAAIGAGGPLVEAAALALTVAGAKAGGVLVCPVNPSTYGTASSVTHAGPGAASMTVAEKPSAQFLVKVVVGGAVATATVSFSVDGGVTWSAPVATAATVLVPNASLVTLGFVGSSGGSFVSGDVWTVSTTGTCTLTSGTGTGTVSLSSASPVDAYNVVVVVTAGGALGAAQFTYSLDGGATVSPPLVTAGSGVYVIPGAGLQITFSGSLTLGDTYSFTTTAASYTTSDLANAWTAIGANPLTWFLAHVVGTPASVSAAATLFAAVEAQMQTFAGVFRYARAAIEVPSDTDTNTLAAFAATVGTRTMACAGFHTYISPLNGRQQSRVSAWSAIARASAVPAQEDLGRVASGSLPGVVSLQRDENATPGLDAGRFTTLRSITGYAGFYVTNGRIMSQPGSDYQFLQYGRVMDIACAASYLALMFFLNDSIQVNGSNGTIAENDARRIESYVENEVRNSLPAGSISDLDFAVSRTNNVLSTQTLNCTLRITPLGYAKTINEDIGFQNPALQLLAA